MNMDIASRSGARLFQVLMAVFLLVCALELPSSAMAPETSPRERISINADWRFHKGDPEGIAGKLDYDVRPQVIRSEDGKVADARPEQATKVAPRNSPVLKSWILPSGNAFIRDKARWHKRPAGNPGSDVAFVADYDDSAWQRVTLPHDWAIAGPFIAEGPYGGMGRLPSWGIGWYRKKLDIPASDRGRSIFLDVDGAMSYATV
jgi:beta-galactosidase